MGLKVKALLIINFCISTVNSVSLLLCNNFLHSAAWHSPRLNIFLPCLLLVSFLLTILCLHFSSKGLTGSLPRPLRIAYRISPIHALIQLLATCWLFLTGASSCHPSLCLLMGCLAQLLVLTLTTYTTYFLWQLWKDMSFNGGLVRVGAESVPTVSLTVMRKEEEDGNHPKQIEQGKDNKAYS